MLIKDTISFVNNTVTLPQSAYPHLEQQGISITMPNRQQLHIHIPPRSSCSVGHNASIADHLSNNQVSIIIGDINAHHSRLETNTKEDESGKQLAKRNQYSRLYHSQREQSYAATDKWSVNFARHQFGLQ